MCPFAAKIWFVVAAFCIRGRLGYVLLIAGTHFARQRGQGFKCNIAAGRACVRAYARVLLIILLCLCLINDGFSHLVCVCSNGETESSR